MSDQPLDLDAIEARCIVVGHITHAGEDIPALTAEVRRLRKLVRTAYNEGFLDGWQSQTSNQSDIDACWEESDSNRETERSDD